MTTLSTIIVPLTVGALVHNLIQRDIVSLFGGFMKHEATTVHRTETGSYDEPVMVYQIAIPRSNSEELRDFAKRAAELANLDSMVVVLPCGEVETIKVN